MLRNRRWFMTEMVVVGLMCVATLALADEVRVSDVPIADGATEISFMKRRGDVRFQVAADFKTVGNFYAKKLAELKWTKSARDNLQSNFLVQTFSKDQASLVVRVDQRGAGSEVRLTPKGMMWEEDDQPSPKDLPLPVDATQIEYDDFFESIEFKSPSNVKTVEGFLSKELEQRKWSKAANEFDFANFVRMKFTQQKSTLEIDVRAEDTGSEVAIRTKGMQWDGMKKEIAEAKKLAEIAASKTPPKQDVAREPASLPKRKDKPKQGIDQLPKLSNEATVVMDGKTYQLPNVIAYEAFEDGEWLTKIVATRKAINQRSLLDKLRLTGTDKGKDDRSHTWPQPYFQVTLGENDRPQRLNLQADGTPGSGSSSELVGTALVEDGRARGTVGLKEPGSFFKKVYTAEISFDVSLLTRDSVPAKRLADAPKLANTGSLTIGNKTYKLNNVVCYRMKRFDESLTTVVFSEKPLNMVNLKLALGKTAADNYFEFIPQVKLLIDADDNLDFMSIWADNISVSSNSDMDGDVVIEDGRARGNARLIKPGEFMDKKYSFELSFDTDVLGEQAASAKKSSGGLTADSYNGLPIPEGHKGMQSEGSRFRKQSTTTVDAKLSAVVEFYRLELASGEWGQWKENASVAKVEPQTAKLFFNGPTGSLIVQLDAKGQEVTITLATRDAQAAKAAGLLPAAGKSRLVVGNATSKGAAITINKQEYNIAAGAGAEDPKTGINWEIGPGIYNVDFKPTGGQVQSEKLKVGADETWGVMIVPTGDIMAIQLY